jgi:hypothetical protein
MQDHSLVTRSSQQAELQEYRGLISGLGTDHEDMVEREKQVTLSPSRMQNDQARSFDVLLVLHFHF